MSTTTMTSMGTLVLVALLASSTTCLPAAARPCTGSTPEFSTSPGSAPGYTASWQRLVAIQRNLETMEPWARPDTRTVVNRLNDAVQALDQAQAAMTRGNTTGASAWIDQASHALDQAERALDRVTAIYHRTVLFTYLAITGTIAGIELAVIALARLRRRARTRRVQALLAASIDIEATTRLASTAGQDTG